MKTALIKVGTNVITTSNDLLDNDVIKHLVDQIIIIKRHIERVVLVTSGAVAAGRAECGMKKRDDETIDRKKMYAAVGQPKLMQTYADFLREYGNMAHQILLTRANFQMKQSRRELEGTLREIFAFERTKPGLVIANENDPIASEELRFTDNDQMSYYLARLIKAQSVVFLTNMNGVLRNLEDPTSRISTVPLGSDMCDNVVQATTSSNGRGGMRNKIKIAKQLAMRGTESTIAHGKENHILERILLEHEDVGTKFLAAYPHHYGNH